MIWKSTTNMYVRDYEESHTKQAEAEVKVD
jgi:hypothetical protein